MRIRVWVMLFLLSVAGSGLAAAERGVVVVRDQTGGEITLYSESHALLIGVSDYSAWPRLENVPSELASVRQQLRLQGFNVVEVSNPDATQLRRAFLDFVNEYGRAPDNRLLFFFSGHGYTLRKGYRREMGYIVPADAPLPERDRNGFLRKAVSMNQVLTWAREIDAKHALFLFDSCFSGTVFKARNLPERPPHISALTAEPVREFITAGSAGETVPAESVFTPAFVNALRHRLGDLDQDGFVTGMELGLHLQAKVPLHTNQTPQFGKIRDYPLSLGDFVFALENAPVPPPPKTVWLRGNVQVNVNVPARVYLGDEGPVPAGPGRPLNRTGVPAGSTEVRVEAKGYQPQSRSVQVARGQWTQLVFELVPEAPAEIAVLRPPPRPDPQADEATLNLTQGQRRRLQRALNARGFAAGPPDGVLGPRSRKALADYQRSQGLEATGYLTAAQWAELGKQSPTPPSRRRDLEPEMVTIRGGCFQMGSPPDERNRDDDERQHRVCVKDFKIGRYEVTQAQWRAVMGDNPSRFKDSDDCPVEQVSWNDVQAYLGKLNARTGERYRLPTEAEWEYACRGGREGERYCGGNDLKAVAWYSRNSAGKTHPVGGKQQNGYGLYDMSGNVQEWTCSAYHAKYGGGEQRCVGRYHYGAMALRGGSWYYLRWSVRSANRAGISPSTRSNNIGFRLVQD